MSEIIFWSRKGNGGYGDRLIGLVSVKYLAKILDYKFTLIWEENMTNIFEDYCGSKLPEHDLNYQWVDDRDCHLGKARDIIPILDHELWKNKKVVIQCNQPILMYLKDNKNLSFNSYERMIREAFSELYKSVCIPTSNLLKEIERFSLEKNLIHNEYVNIHIRCGDGYIKNAGGVKYLSESEIDNYLSKCLENIDEKETIFLSSDSVISHQKCAKLNRKIIFMSREEDIHFDHTMNDLEDIVMEHLLMSRAKLIFTSLTSNFGTTAALSGDHDNIFLLDNFGAEVKITKLNYKILPVLKSNRLSL